MRGSAIKYLLFAALAIPAGYLAVQLFVVLDRPYKTETAIQYDMSDSLLCEGYLVFQQVQVPGEGQLGYLVENGERVAAGAQVAEIYTDASQARARLALGRLDEQLDLLERSENTTGSEVDVLLRQRQTALYDLLDQLDRQNYSQAAQKSSEYLLALNRLQITTGAIDDFSGAKELLEQERQVQLALLGSPGAVTAPTGGYFVAQSAAKNLLYSQDELDAMTAGQLQEALQQQAGAGPIQGAGKLVTSYKWYFYGVCTAQQSEKFEEITSVDISFPGAAEKTLPAKVESVQLDEAAGLAKVVLSCEYVGADVLSLTQASARIDFASFEGIRVNAKALNIVNGEKGVYVKYGNLARFRRITILYQDDEYILVPEGGKVGTDNEVRLFDEIIVEGTDLKDGKLL